MAQVTRLGLWLLLLVSATAWAQDAKVPPEGLRAEGEKRWDDAIAIYQEALRKDPTREDLWLRIADIHAARGEKELAADATSAAARLRSNDVTLLRRASQAEAMANRKEQALAWIRRAVKMAPDDVEYLQAQAELAAWNDDVGLAAESYRDLLRLNPADHKALLGLARMQSRQGKLDVAASNFERYLKILPDDADALLSYADTEIYRGAWAHAEELQDHARTVAGETPAWRKARANLRARSGRPRAALAIDEGLLCEAPDDYDLHVIRAVALQAVPLPRQAREELGIVEQMGPDRPETRGTRLRVETPLRASLRLSQDVGDYSDSTRDLRSDLELSFQAMPELRLSFGAEHRRMGADSDSGLQPASGSRYIDLEQGWGKARYQANRWLAVEGGVGWADNGRGDGEVTYLAGVQVQPCDRFDLRLRREHDILALSPRTIDQFIERDRNEFDSEWRPLYGVVVDTGFEYDWQDDGNRVEQGYLAPRVAVVRTQHINFDLGARGEMYHYAEDGVGYYTPDVYMRLHCNAYAYWKISDNDGLGLVAGLGPERDPDLDTGAKLGVGTSVEGTFGVYRNWQLRVHAGYDWREGANAFRGGGFNGRSAGLELILRF